jgi:asparagine synthase (glutamine-hydrolysing)
MCGIVGGDHSPPIDGKTLLAIRDVMAYREPDDAGLFMEKNIGLGSRRLSIIDLSEQGHMPMAGRYIIVYNGEIYNYLELRSELEIKGRSFY